MNSILVVEDHQEMRSALRVAAIEAGAVAFVSKRELPHGLLPILDRLDRLKR